MTYPSTWLPAPTVTFGHRGQAASARTEMDTGRVRQRQRFSRVHTSISAEWELTDEQLAIFKGFYEHTTSGGTAFFDMELPLGDGLATYSVRFVGVPSFQHYGVLYWRATATLELESGGPLTSDVTGGLLLVEDLSAFESAASAFHTYVHETIPDTLP